MLFFKNKQFVNGPSSAEDLLDALRTGGGEQSKKIQKFDLLFLNRKEFWDFLTGKTQRSRKLTRDLGIL